MDLAVKTEPVATHNRVDSPTARAHLLRDSAVLEEAKRRHHFVAVLNLLATRGDDTWPAYPEDDRSVEAFESVLRERMRLLDARREERAAIEASYRQSADFVEPAIASRLAPSIPPRFAEATLRSFEADTAPLQAAIAAVRSWAARVMDGKPAMLALIGSQGTGKSHLLYAAARGLVMAGTRVWHRPWYRLADELRYGGADAFTGAKLEAADVRAALYRERVVLIDEVRPTAGTAFDDTELTKFACHCYDQCHAVLITTNVNPLAEVMGAAAASRFTQVVIDGEDRRQRR